jgi:hypothetical protein
MKPTRSPIQWVLGGTYTGGKTPGAWSYHSSPVSVRVKNALSVTLQNGGFLNVGYLLLPTGVEMASVNNLSINR